MLQVGQPAPEFELPDADMDVVSLAEFRGRKNVVLYFYPHDGTPSCTMESTDFSDHYDEFERHHTEVLGISMDDVLLHSEFRERHGIAVRLLSDADGTVCGSYGVLRQEERGGVRRPGVQRATFLIDKRGRIVQAWYGIKARGHAAEVLQTIRSTSQCR